MWVVCSLLLCLSHICLLPRQLQWLILPVVGTLGRVLCCQGPRQGPLWAHCWMMSGVIPDACPQPVSWDYSHTSICSYFHLFPGQGSLWSGACPCGATCKVCQSRRHFRGMIPEFGMLDRAVLQENVGAQC